MSGIYIKGMEMPTSCIACHLNFGEKRPEHGLTIYCPYSDGVISWRDKAFDNGRLASCGIVPVPEHGRLIDEKDIVPKDGYIIADGMACIPVKDIVNAPTIIPADPEDKEGER